MILQLLSCAAAVTLNLADPGQLAGWFLVVGVLPVET
jgi:hypothetical protein